MKLKVVFEPSEEGGYTVYVPSLPGCISEGNSKEEALINIKEAIELYLEPLENDLMTTPNSQIMEVAILSKVPNIGYEKVINALQRDDWMVIRSEGKPYSTAKTDRGRNFKSYGSGTHSDKAFYSITYFKTSTFDSRGIFRFIIKLPKLLAIELC
ncbi:type II toxin-antitoxin system HicB family antitoxin [Candidatus Parabeggiatoa sp. HSG14]|uniref:type II toxin-antitoxin system HicB family antitoxin n=1 Tax=Candidatus Parabeggiatoa sp. HSG14 TaxID=3055593 RepID=UPI0025A7731F|nr:type II toxin-antitoxin system HicB family antitoxin [Thiotrichales bacterium HSG14]